LNGETTGLRDLPGRGGRLIIVHVGSEEGFLKDPTNPSGSSDARWVFRAKKTAKIENANHHDEMNSKAFNDWFEGVLHMLPPDSVIVMDNASYHCETLLKVPTMSWKKKEIQDWLTQNGVFFEPESVKAELLRRIPAHLRLAARQYKVDKLAEDCGHTVLRLPPYHCELNPIELAWAMVKNDVARNNTDYSLKSVEMLLEQALDRITADNWSAFVSHVKKVEDYMWELDAISDDVQDRIIINLEEESEDSSENSDCDYSDDELATPLL
jgi:transposase